jgi:hypothetical protein
MRKLSQDILPESNGRSIVLKANYFWFQNTIKQTPLIIPILIIF